MYSLICSGCGEPWELSAIMEDDCEFDLVGSLLKECPCCRKDAGILHEICNVKKTSEIDKVKAQKINDLISTAEIIADLCGDDIDFASSITGDFLDDAL